MSPWRNTPQCLLQNSNVTVVLQHHKSCRYCAAHQHAVGLTWCGVLQGAAHHQGQLQQLLPKHGKPSLKPPSGRPGPNQHMPHDWGFFHCCYRGLREVIAYPVRWKSIFAVQNLVQVLVKCTAVC